MNREILEQLITQQNDGSYHARVEFTDNGERRSLSRNFTDFSEATAWLINVENGQDIAPGDTIPEPAASDMTAEDAERINSNVVPAPKPAGAESIPNGEQSGVTESDQTAADTEQPPEDTDTSNEVEGTQDASAVAHNSSNQPAEQGSDQPNENSDAKADTAKKKRK